MDDFVFRAGVTVIQPNGDQSQALVTAIDPLLHGVYRLGAADHRGGQNGAERKQPGHQSAGGTLAGVPMLPGRSIKRDHQRDSQKLKFTGKQHTDCRHPSRWQQTQNDADGFLSSPGKEGLAPVQQDQSQQAEK